LLKLFHLHEGSTAIQVQCHKVTKEEDRERKGDQVKHNEQMLQVKLEEAQMAADDGAVSTPSEGKSQLSTLLLMTVSNNIQDQSTASWTRSNSHCHLRIRAEQTRLL